MAWCEAEGCAIGLARNFRLRQRIAEGPLGLARNGAFSGLSDDLTDDRGPLGDERFWMGLGEFADIDSLAGKRRRMNQAFKATIFIFVRSCLSMRFDDAQRIKSLKYRLYSETTSLGPLQTGSEAQRYAKLDIWEVIY